MDLIEATTTRTPRIASDERLGRVYAYILSLRPRADDSANAATNQDALPPAGDVPGDVPDATGG